MCNQCHKKRSSCTYRRNVDGPINGPRCIPSAGTGSCDSPPPLQAIDGFIPPSRPSLDDGEQLKPDGTTASADLPSGAVHGVFVGEVRDAINARLGVPSGKRVATSATPLADAPLFELRLSLQTGESDDSVLPQRRHADHLVNMFWQHIQPLEPFLERELFYRSYEALYAGHSPEGADERIFLIILNTIFALSAQLQENLPAEERNRASCTYFRRAWAMLRVEAVLWEPGSLDMVQCLLLIGRYLQCSNNPHRTWMVVGTAVRMAQSIGLDKPAPLSPNNTGDRISRDFREQLWQCCVYMDR